MALDPQAHGHERRQQTRHKLDDDVQVVNADSGKTLGIIADLHNNGFMLAGTGKVKTDRVYNIKLLLPRHVNGLSEVAFQAECLWISNSMSEESSLFWAGFQILPDTQRSLLSVNDVIAEFSAK